MTNEVSNGLRTFRIDTSVRTIYEYDADDKCFFFYMHYQCDGSMSSQAFGILNLILDGIKNFQVENEYLVCVENRGDFLEKLYETQDENGNFTEETEEKIFKYCVKDI